MRAGYEGQCLGDIWDIIPAKKKWMMAINACLLEAGFPAIHFQQYRGDIAIPIDWVSEDFSARIEAYSRAFDICEHLWPDDRAPYHPIV